MLLLGLIIWGGITLLQTRHRPGGRGRAALVLGPIAGLIVIGCVLFFFSAGFDKMRAEGFEIGKRLDTNLAALQVMGDGQLLGTGLGSVVGLIDPAVPKTVVYDLRLYQLHNDVLQVLLELGLPGLAGLFILLYLLLEPVFSHPDRYPDGQVGMIWAFVAVLLVHSLIEFPLRILSIRTFALLVVCAMVAEVEPSRVLVGLRASLILPLIAVLCATTYLGFYVAEIPPSTGQRGDIAWSLRYGKPHRVDFIRGAEIMDRLLWQGVSLEEAPAELARARAHLYANLEARPLSLEAMNLLFMAELLEHRIAEPGFDRGVFAAFEARAEAIGRLGHPSGPDAKLARFFLYALYVDHLDAAERKQHDEWKRSLWLLLRKATEPAEAAAPIAR